MTLTLSKELVEINSDSYYIVSAKVNDTPTNLELHVPTSMTDAEIETEATNVLIEEGYASEDLTPIEWV